MLIESTLAVIALIVVATMAQDKVSSIEGGPGAVFSIGIGSILGSLGFGEKAAVTFTALAVSAFALTSLDTVARVGRFIFQELFSGRGPIAGRQLTGASLLLTNRFIASAIMILAGGYLALSGKWQFIWPLFGSSNQMMAAIALLAITMWLVKKKNVSWFVQIPMYIMFAVTISALVTLCISNFKAANYILGVIAIFLLVVTGVLIIEAVRSIKNKTVTGL
jgi:carbon starvation protein